MATVSAILSPHAISNMPTTRAPLRDAPSAVLNSPLRGASTATIGSKRDVDRASVTTLNRIFELDDEGNPLPKKRRFVETAASNLKLHGLPPRRSGQSTALQRRLEAARNPNTLVLPQSKSKAEPTLDSYKQWQEHHRRAFPSFVFYFDNIQDDAKHKYIHHIRNFGAREEQFFSKSVTHVVTSRPIPSTDITTSSSTGIRSPAKDAAHTGRTINPSLLDNQRANHKFTFEAPAGKKMPTDILSKARDMKMKVWTLEKFGRILNALSRAEPGQPGVIDIKQSQPREKQSRDAELSRLLREDRRNANVEKNWMIDMVPFRGCYIYVRDIDERSKPIMVRDYPKPVSKEHGKWPQLRPSPPSRCPFLEDGPTRRATEPTRKPSVEQPKRQPRAMTLDQTTLNARGQTEQQDAVHQVLQERKNPPGMRPPESKRASTDQLPLYGSAQASLRRVPRFIQGEPVASGVQPSNVTSAVRSQMISSTAAVPGGKVGASREFNALRRKVVEKNGIPDPSLIRAAINADASKSHRHRSITPALHDDTSMDVNRGTKRKNLDDIAEDDDVQQIKVVRKRRAVEKEPKPGYCENCRDKFEDFEEHILSREHRKFALNADNFNDLDALLAKLQRV